MGSTNLGSVYLKKNKSSENSSNQNLNLPCAGNYLNSICVAFTTIYIVFTSRYCLAVKLYPTLCNPMDCSPPGSSVHGILQVRLLEWVAIPSSQGSSQPRDEIHVSYVSWIGQQGSLPLALPRKQNNKRKVPARRQGDMKMEMSPRSSWGYENYSVKVEENIAPL